MASTAATTVAFYAIYYLFLKATKLSMKAFLSALVASDGFDLSRMIAIASLGNTLGACVNWALGRYCLRWQEKRWFPISTAGLERGTKWFRRYGLFALRAHAAIRGDTVSVSGAAIRQASCHQKAVEASARRAGMLEAAFDALPQPLALWRKDGSLDLANAAFRAAYDLDDGQCAMRRDALAAESRHQAVVVRRNHGACGTAAEVRTARGAWMRIAEHSIEDGARLTVGTDITSFRQEQTRLQAEQERLREKVSAMALDRRKLELKCASLERSLEGKTAAPRREDTVLADASVPAEIRTALTSVLGFSELMMAETDKTSGGKLNDYARHIHSGGEALQALVRRLEGKPHAPAAGVSGHEPVVRRRIG